MSKNQILQPEFKLSFLLPKYWLVWLGICVLYSISWLPYRLQLALGRCLGRIAFAFNSSRKHVAQRNLELCFPAMDAAEVQSILKRNFENTGIALFETGMGWWWPDWRVKRKVKVTGTEHIQQAQAQGQGVFLIGMHFLSAEISCRGIGYGHPMVVFYRPHNNPLMEYFQFRGRSKSNKYMLSKRDVKGLLQALSDGEACVYLPDQDYGRNRSIFVPFFNVQDAATTTGTTIFAGQDNVVTLMLIPTRNDDDSGYSIDISAPLENFPVGDQRQDLIRINHELERAILQKPEQYMWVHRRFKTRPNKSDPSLYD